MNIELIKRLREETGAAILDVKQALADFDNDYNKAKDHLMKKALLKADKKAERNAADGLIHSYIHLGGKMGSLVHIACETDFVAKTEDFKKLCNEVALQVCTEDYENIEALLAAPYIRDERKSVSDLVKETIAKTGEKIQIINFARFSVR